MATALLNPNTADPVSLSLRTLYQDVTASSVDYERYTLLEVTHFKHKGLVAHEFLILHMSDGNGRTLQLCMERRPSLVKSEDPQGSIFTPIADDTIHQEPNYNPRIWASKFRKLSNTRCPDRPIVTLPMICEILYQMYRISQTYRVMSRQCYWLCTAFLVLLEEIPHLRLSHVKGTHHHLSGFCGLFQVGLRVRLMSEEEVKESIREFLEKERGNQYRREEAEKDSIKRGFDEAIRNQKKAARKAVKRTRKSVEPLLMTSKSREDVEKQHIKTSFTRTVESSRGKDDVERRAEDMMREVSKRIRAGS